MREIRASADLVNRLLEAKAPLAVAARRRRFVGTSEACFDGSRFQCLDGRLPWSEWHDLQAAMAEAEEVSQADFYAENGVSRHVLAAIKSHTCRYLVSDDSIGVLHDQDADIHYFFIQ